MSETQDILEFADQFVTIDRSIREQTPLLSGMTGAFALADAYNKDGKFIGEQSLLEDTKICLAGLDVNEAGLLVFMITVDEKEGLGETDPYKWALGPVILDDCCPPLSADLDRIVRANTEFISADYAAEGVRRRLFGKRALLDTFRARLKEGRRAYVEAHAEIKELASAEFYADQPSFGIF